MGLNFPGGTQNGPCGVIQIQSWQLNSIYASSTSQSAWYDWLGGSNNYGITLKADNSDIILHSSLNLDVNGGSTGQFLRWQYRVGTGGSWSNFNSATSPGNRQQGHFALKQSAQNDPRHRSHRQILYTNLSRGTTVFFKLQTYLIPGANYIKMNHATNDSDSVNNVRTSSYIFLEEFSNPS